MNLEIYNPLKSIIESLHKGIENPVSPLCGSVEKFLKSFTRSLIGMNLIEPPQSILKTKFC